MKKNLRRFLALICACALLLTSASALSVDEAIELLEFYYVDELPSDAYQAANLDELFLTLGDPYTYYMTAEEFSAFNEAVEDTTSVVGIGVQIKCEKDGIHITTVINGGPAEKVGLKAGDIIVAIDGSACVPAIDSDATRVRGKAGTQVVLSVAHPDGSQEDYSVTRATVVVENTNISMNGHIGVIDCNSFGSTTADLIRTGIQSHENDAEIWWVDLRDNSGGLADVAVETVGMFAGDGIQLYYRDAADSYTRSYSIDAPITEHPVIVLTNALSASASELFAADIRDRSLGISVGGRTFGKGVVQIILDGENLSDYFTDDAMKVTAFRFYSALTNTTDMIGVIPTILVPDEQTEAVATLLSGQVPEDSNGWLKIQLADWYWYVDAGSAQKNGNSDPLDELLSALPPDVILFAGSGAENWTAISVTEAISMYGSSVDSRWFPDLAGSSFADALNTLATYNILQGDKNGAFHPKSTLTRAELCSLLTQALGVDTDLQPSYSDVASNSWYASAIALMTNIGMVEGYEDGTFHPNEIVTNEQFITIMARLTTFLNAAMYDIEKNITDDLLDDERLSKFPDWAKKSAYLMLFAQTYRKDGSAAIAYTNVEDIDPSAPVLREEAGVSLYNLLKNVGILFY